MTHHLWMDSNFKPLARAGDDALWNRIHLMLPEVTILQDYWGACGVVSSFAGFGPPDLETAWLVQKS